MSFAEEASGLARAVEPLISRAEAGSREVGLWLR